MSIFDAFKPKWSGRSMSEQDRKALFWYLRRASSYTAWKRQADEFDRFASVVERQVRDEPIAPQGCRNPASATHWDESYLGVLKGQVLYEQGLGRLLQGDRTVWRYNDLGVLVDALNIHQHWWSALVNHGPHGDVYLDGKYVGEMTAIIEGGAIRHTAGIVQTERAEPLAHYFWSKEFMAEIGSGLPSPEHLPVVPPVSREVTVRSGEPVPCCGIFEPQVQDGCMNYLLEGAPAPRAVNVDEVDGDFVIRPTVWRLLWEDTRYYDGVIPDEESLYFPTMDALKLAIPVDVQPDPLIRLLSNRSVTHPGIWVVEDRLDVRRRFELGEVLPEYEGQIVQWLWVGKR